MVVDEKRVDFHTKYASKKSKIVKSDHNLLTVNTFIKYDNSSGGSKTEVFQSKEP